MMTRLFAALLPAATAALSPARTTVLAYNKPPGCTCTHVDELGRPTVYELLRERLPPHLAQVRWHSCGRLDMNTSGLLLLTNDGSLLKHVTDPTDRAGPPLVKTYRCVVHALGEEAVEQMRRGVSLGGGLGTSLPAEVEVEAQAEGGRRSTSTLRVRIGEGRNRQVRRMVHAVGSGVIQLHRTAVGGVELGGLPPGEWRVLSDEEVRRDLNYDAGALPADEAADAAEAGLGAASSAAGAASSYALLDSGDRRRLEVFGGLRVVRACPSAEWRRGLGAAQWRDADLEFEAGGGGWSGRRLAEVVEAAEKVEAGTASAEDPAWLLRSEEAGVVLGLHPGPNGQLGAFPEQADNWEWLREASEAADQPSVLNLFGHTGGSSLACAAGGARVTHVDGARSAVGRARSNARAAGLGDAPIRWLCEDASTYVARALKRGERFDGLVVDPPAFGRGGDRKAEWRIARDLPPMLEMLDELLSDRPAFVLLTCHDARWPAERLGREVGALLRRRRGGGARVDHGAMVLRAADAAGRGGRGRDLPMGCFARWRAAPGAARG